MKARKNLERALILLAALSLCACTTSPRSEFAWNLRDRRPPKPPSQVVEYGPRSVTLPPVQRRALPAPGYVQQQPAPQTPVPKPKKTPGWYTPSPAPQSAPSTDDGAVRTADANVQFRWPVAGRIVIVSDFGASAGGERNDGVNIAAQTGTPVHAAAAGTVSYCGNELKGFGNLVLIRHDNGYITAYAHVGSILVGREQRVAAGQVIATSGATGDVSSPQLHFEIRQGVRPVNPKSLLPKTLVVASS